MNTVAADSVGALVALHVFLVLYFTLTITYPSIAILFSKVHEHG